jgi:hypothetical protein
VTGPAHRGRITSMFESFVRARWMNCDVIAGNSGAIGIAFNPGTRPPLLLLCCWLSGCASQSQAESVWIGRWRWLHGWLDEINAGESPPLENERKKPTGYWYRVNLITRDNHCPPHNVACGCSSAMASPSSMTAHATLCSCSLLRILLPKYSPGPQRGCANAGWGSRRMASSGHGYVSMRCTSVLQRQEDQEKARGCAGERRKADRGLTGLVSPPPLTRIRWCCASSYMYVCVSAEICVSRRKILGALIDCVARQA